jgi:DME family drug/metabolite transporter
MSHRTVPAHAWRGVLLVSAAGVVWGTIGPAVQVAHESSGLSPWVISAYRAILAALGSGAAYAVATHVGAPLSRDHGALEVTAATTSVAAGVLVPGGLIAAALRGEPMTTTELGSWLLLVYLGIVTMAFAYVLLYAGLRSTTSGSAVVATLLEPVTAVLIAVLLLGERPTAAVVLGTLLVLAAIASLGRQGGPEPEPQAQ